MVASQKQNEFYIQNEVIDMKGLICMQIHLDDLNYS